MNRPEFDNSPPKGFGDKDSYDQPQRVRLSGFIGNDLLSKSGIASPVVSSELDANVQDNLYQQLNRAFEPAPDTPSEAVSLVAKHTEQAPLFDHIIESGMSGEAAMATIARHYSENGVSSNPDGSFMLQVDGKQSTVYRDGVPLDPHA